MCGKLHGLSPLTILHSSISQLEDRQGLFKFHNEVGSWEMGVENTSSHFPFPSSGLFSNRSEAKIEKKVDSSTPKASYQMLNNTTYGVNELNSVRN